MPAKVYTLSTADEEHSGFNYQVPSMEYLMECLSDIENILRQHFGDVTLHKNKDSFNGLHSVKYDSEDLPIGVEDVGIINADDIKTDDFHMFITKRQFNEFKNKPSSDEIDIKFEDVSNNLKSYFNDMYVKLLNMPDATKKLKAISAMLKEDEPLAEALSSGVNSISTDELSEHIASKTHLEPGERDAINAFMDAIYNGINWEAGEDELIHISNKPTEIKASGGNADTVAGYGPIKVLTRREYDTYVGVSGNGYDRCDVDIFFDKNSSMSLEVASNASTFFRKGIYNFESFTIEGDHTIIVGSDYLTTINCQYESPIVLSEYCVFKDLTIANATVNINSRCKFNSVIFKDCHIIMDRACNNTITDCYFTGKDSSFKYVGSCVCNVITNNRLAPSCNKLKIVYRGGNNYVQSNFTE